MVDELDPKAVPDYFSKAGTVEQWWSPDTGPLAFHYDAELQVIDEQLVVAQNSNVLDVGTGRGRFAIHMAAKGCRVVAVDINSEMLGFAAKAAQEKGVGEEIEFNTSSAEDLSGIDEEGFDVVLCMELFDHLPDLGKALGQMRQRLRADGSFVFTYVPSESLYGLLGNIYRWLRRKFRAQSVMISRTYSLAEIEESLAANGFELDRHFGVGVLCINAQTRLFRRNPLSLAVLALARVEARFRPYHEGAILSRYGAHVVGIARPVDRKGN